MTGPLPKAWLAWSSGKDSAWALHVAREERAVEIVGLLTTVTDAYDRVSMHGVRNELLDAQAVAAGLPLHRVVIPPDCSNEIYEAAMADALASARTEGVTHVVFGDLFLEDLRAYRESRMAEVGMTAHFPLWKLDTTALARDMVEAGVRAHLACVDTRVLPAEFAGRVYDATLLADLPPNVDPCGENGEFHTFASAGPAFRTPIPVRTGEVVRRDGFVFADLLPA